jgi:SagB-type dehydrogenase family enzyme
MSMAQTETRIQLPAPRLEGGASIEEVLQQRRSIRTFTHQALDLDEISQLLWAAQGITHPEGLRTAPSAGALYPLEIYLVAGKVRGLDEGVYHYRADEHALDKTLEGDKRKGLARAALGQSWIRDAPAVLVFTAIFPRTTKKYGQRGKRYVHIEVGHAGQNVFLQAVSMGLGSVVVGAFNDQDVSQVLQFDHTEQPLSLMPVGRPQ